MIRVFIDDIRNPVGPNWIVIRSYSDAVNWFNKYGCPDFISFDHDLGEDYMGTGFDVAKWMVDKDLDMDGYFIPKNFTFNVHSANPIGKANIETLLYNYLRHRNA